MRPGRGQGASVLFVMTSASGLPTWGKLNRRSVATQAWHAFQLRFTMDNILIPFLVAILQSERPNFTQISAKCRKE